MTPRPPYRWKSFWLGLLVLAFFAWAWRHSFGRLSNVTRYQKTDFYQVNHIDGEILVRRGSQTGLLGGQTGWRFHSASTSLSAARIKADLDRYGDAWLAIPYAPVIGISALCFGTFVVWRTRRWKRHAVNLAADLSEQP